MLHSVSFQTPSSLLDYGSFSLQSDLAECNPRKSSSHIHAAVFLAEATHANFRF
jgi:hypothetical protein